MSFGYERQGRTFLNNTKLLQAHVYNVDDTALVPQSDLTSVTFTVVRPGDLIATPVINAVAGTISGDGQGEYLVSAAVTTVAGEYHAMATFIYIEDARTHTKSIPVDFEIIDPYVRIAASAADDAVAQAWLKIEDCFDSEYGGPWLRDMTLAVFNKGKVKALLPEVLLEINQQMPFTDYDEAGFPYDVSDGEALLAEGLLCATLRHLMRSYTEQPMATGSPVAYADRSRYQQAWASIYSIEMERYKVWLKQFKLRSYDITHASVLLGNKAGRLIGAPMRSRNFHRGY